MREDISKLLKLTFLVHFFVAILFGLVYLIFLEFYVEVTGWLVVGYDPIAGRTLGATFIGFGVGSLLCWRETEWVRVKIVVQMEIAWLIIGTIVQFWAAFSLFTPIIIWLNIVVCLFFAIAFSWFYYIQEMGK